MCKDEYTIEGVGYFTSIHKKCENVKRPWYWPKMVMVKRIAVEINMCDNCRKYPLASYVDDNLIKLIKFVALRKRLAEF